MAAKAERAVDDERGIDVVKKVEDLLAQDGDVQSTHDGSESAACLREARICKASMGVI